MAQQWNPSRVGRALTVSGSVAITMSAVTLILGLVMVEGGAKDFRSTVQVSGDAIEAILTTVDVVEEATIELQEGIDAAASGISGVSSTAIIGAGSIEDLAVFLETDLPTDLEAIRSAMPAAIQAAGAIDGTLRALSLVGVNYNPREPFDESLRRVEEALTGLPEDLRTQSEALRDLVPAAAGLAGEADRLSLTLIRLGEDLEGIQEIAQSYNETLEEANVTIQRTEETIDRNLWLLRITLVAVTLGGAALGVGLLAMGRFVESLRFVDGTLMTTEVGRLEEGDIESDSWTAR